MSTDGGGGGTRVGGSTLQGFLLAIAVAMLAAGGVFFYLVGSETLRTVALIISIGITGALILGASALPIRAYRRKDPTNETHYVHDGTKTVVKETRVIDGRSITSPEVKLLQLPAQHQGAAFPELLRAAFAAGQLTDGRTNQPASGAQVGPEEADATLREWNLAADSDGWDGDVTP